MRHDALVLQRMAVVAPTECAISTTVTPCSTMALRPSNSLIRRFCPVYSAPMCSPFSATERFMSGTRNTSATARTANSQKSSK